MPNTKELADAKARSAALQHKLDNGGRVLVKGKCPVSAITTTTGAASLGDDATVELSQLLDETFSVSASESSATKQP